VIPFLVATALAQAPICADLLAKPPRLEEARTRLDGLDPDTRCPHRVLVHEAWEPTPRGVLWGLLLPPLGLALLADHVRGDQYADLEPTLLELALGHGDRPLVDALLPEARIEPPAWHTAIARDLYRRGDWTTMLLVHGQPPTDVLVSRPDLHDRLLDRPDLLGLLREAGLDPLGLDDRGDDFLFRAAEAGRTDRVRRLLDEGFDATTVRRGRTALALAAEDGHVEVAALLLDRGAIVRDDDLVHAARTRSLPLVDLLLHHGAPVSTDALEAAARTRGDDVVRRLLEHGPPLGNAVSHAAEAGSLEVLHALLEAGGDPGAEWVGQTPVQRAARGGKDGHVDLLLGRGGHALDWQPRMPARPDFLSAVRRYERTAAAARRRASSLNADQRAELALETLAAGFEDGAAGFVEDPDALHEALRRSTHPGRQAQLDWARGLGARYRPGDLPHAVEAGSTAQIAEAMADGATDGRHRHLGRGAAELALARGPAIVDAVVGHAELPRDWSPERLLQFDDAGRLVAATRLGFRPGRRTVRDAALADASACLDALAELFPRRGAFRVREVSPATAAQLARLRDAM
jgi:ankyrin repeat protein